MQRYSKYKKIKNRGREATRNFDLKAVEKYVSDQDKRMEREDEKEKDFFMLNSRGSSLQRRPQRSILSSCGYVARVPEVQKHPEIAPEKSSHRKSLRKLKKM